MPFYLYSKRTLTCSSVVGVRPSLFHIHNATKPGTQQLAWPGVCLSWIHTQQNGCTQFPTWSLNRSSSHVFSQLSTGMQDKGFCRLIVPKDCVKVNQQGAQDMTFKASATIQFDQTVFTVNIWNIWGEIDKNPVRNETKKKSLISLKDLGN